MIKKMDSESSSQFECVDGERCQSYNFGTVNGYQEIFKCKLCDSDRFAGFANLTEDKDLIHRGMMVSQICLSASKVTCGSKFKSYYLKL